MGLDQAEIEEMWRLKQDFPYFCEKVLGLEMTEYHKEIAALPLKHRYLCIIIPTGFSKTTLYSIAYPIWRLFREEKIEICLVSSSITQSEKIFSYTQQTLETNPFFSEMLPSDRFKTWNKKQIVTRNGNQYYIRPFNDTARGIHPNYLIYDDLLRESELNLEEVKEIFWRVFFPRGQIHKCQHIVVGTPQSVEDLYAILERKPDWFVVRKPAVTEDSRGKWVKSLWPERFSLKTLREIRSNMTPFAFEREYLCRPRATGDTLYPQEMVLNCMDYNLDFNYDIKGMQYIGADYAMSTKASGDFNVFTVVDSVEGSYIKQTDKGPIEVKNPVFIRKIIRFRGSVGQTENVTALHDYFPEARIIADSSGVGIKFIQELREQNFSVDAQDFVPKRRNLLLMGLRRLVEKNRLVIPGGDESTSLVNRLLRELTSFHSVKTRAGHESWQSNIKHDDMAISLAMAVKHVASPRKMLPQMFYGI